MATTYCTLDDLKTAVTARRLIEATDDENPTGTGTIDEDIVDAAISQAGTVIDSYIGKRYPLPLPAVPDVLKHFAVSLAIYFLFSRVQDGEMAQGVSTRYNNAISILKNIRDGSVSLGQEVTELAPAPVGPVISAPKPMFSHRRLDRMDADIHPMRSW